MLADDINLYFESASNNSIDEANKGEKVIILPFQNNTGDIELDGLSDTIPRLTSVEFMGLINRGDMNSIKVARMNREELGYLLDEIGLSLSHFGDPRSVAEIGKRKLATLAVSGSYNETRFGCLDLLSPFFSAPAFIRIIQRRLKSLFRVLLSL